jgi:alpha-mannosidase
MRCAAEVKEPINEILCFYGVGNHGGGPTRENIDSIHRLQGEPGRPEILFSTPDAFFESVRAEKLPIPVVHDELQHHASGCYAAHSGIKRWNRLAENQLLTAEKFSSLASWLTGMQYPAEFEQAWKDVLFNQFHDVLAGTCIKSAYDDARDLYGEALSIAGRALNNAIQSISWKVNIPTEEGSRPFLWR